MNKKEFSCTGHSPCGMRQFCKRVSVSEYPVQGAVPSLWVAVAWGGGTPCLPEPSEKASQRK